MESNGLSLTSILTCAVRALLESVEFYPLFSVLNWLYLVKILILIVSV